MIKDKGFCIIRDIFFSPLLTILLDFFFFDFDNYFLYKRFPILYKLCCISYLFISIKSVLLVLQPVQDNSISVSVFPE